MTDHLSLEMFTAQFPELVLAARDLPRKALPLNILLVSTILRLDPDHSYSEAEINAQLQRWVLEFGHRFKLEHVELRRTLVDAGYLIRDPAGTAYQVNFQGGRFTYDESLRRLDLVALVAKAQEEREVRKRAHTRGSHENGT